MTTLVVVGAQWGDEGKGKIIDYLASEAEMVVRCQGGSNAGHTVVSKGDVYKFHLIPSGILFPGVTCIIGNGVVLDLGVVLQELDDLKKRGVDTSNLYISERAHLIMPYHCRLDALQEQIKGDNKIGTTKRGIGPAYADKSSRTGLRVLDLLKWDSFKEKLAFNVAEKNHIFAAYGEEPVDLNEILVAFKDYAQKIKPFVRDTVTLINDAIKQNKKVLFEGAQGSLLDLDLGTYPFVTSSNAVAGGVCAGSGVGPTKLQKIYGISKAYTTRVGSGPFPSELLGEAGDELCRIGCEYGTTTGRARRCGWFDAVVGRYSVMINGMTDLVITKLDVLDYMPEIKICTAYRYEGKEVQTFPADLDLLAKCDPVYETMPGWSVDTTKCRSYDDLPQAAKNYLNRLGELCEVPISIVAIGPDREQTITLNPAF